MLVAQLLSLALFVVLASGFTVPGLPALRYQMLARLLAVRSESMIDTIFDDLDYPSQDFININLKELQKQTNGSKCDSCKQRLRFARNLVDSQPDKQHLISLLLYKYCVEKKSDAKCAQVDFFLTTTSKDLTKQIGDLESGSQSGTSVDFYDNDFLQMIKNFNMSSETDMEYYCYFKAKGDCDLPETPDIDISSWWPEKKESYNQAPQYKSENRSVFNVLHLSDFHIQYRYTVGAEGMCEDPPCCLPESLNETLPTKNYNFTSVYSQIDAAASTFNYSFYPDAHYDKDGNYVKGKYYDLPSLRGYESVSLPASSFGGYFCDPPQVLINNSMKYVGQVFKDKKFEFAIFTGDMVDHDEYHCDLETTQRAERDVANVLKKHLPGIPVFPTLGNHDTFPYGQMAPISLDSNHTLQYNAEYNAKLWVDNSWLPKNMTNSLKTHYAGFSTVTKRGLKVISLNSNAYYQKNLWAYINLSQEPDLFGQWKFLIDELVESEKIGQRVWIMAHIPTGDTDTLPIQSHIFSKIIERFSPYTVAHIFFGHTHQDQFRILYSANGQDAQDAINVAYVSQSITPLTEYNPSWRYYEVEDESFNIMNTFNYYTPLNETFVNGGDEPRWDFEYSARETYDPNGEWPKSAPLNATFWHNFILSKLNDTSNIDFNQKYMELQYRQSPYVPQCKNDSSITDECYTLNYCVGGTFLSDVYAKCLKE